LPRSPFARVAALLSALLQICGAVNAGTVRNRTVRVGVTVAKLTMAGAQMLEPDAATPRRSSDLVVVMCAAAINGQSVTSR
jgi:hypothetical protein